jgi:hypothetical protein
MLEISKKHYHVDDSPTGRYYFGDEETRGTHDRVPSESYAVWVRDQVDPEPKYTDFHPRLLKERGVQSITLLEHLLFHLKYFRETGQFLDRNEIRTLCFGSRDADGCIPCVILKKWQSGNHWVYLTYGQLHVSVREVIA